LRSSFTVSDSSLLLELLPLAAGAPPADTLVVSLDASAVAVTDVSSVLSLTAVLFEAVVAVGVIETEVMLTMAVFHWVYGITVIIDIDTADLRLTVYRLGKQTGTQSLPLRA
jgi:hypothetical protein